MPANEKEEIKNLIFELDLELPVKYSGPESDNPQLAWNHDYTVVRFTEESVRQECSVCGRDNQAARRATIRHDSTGILFHSGLDCLENNFGVQLAELISSTRDLRKLARGWQRFCAAMGFDPGEAATSKAVVEDMRDYFTRVPSLKEVTTVITEMLGNLPQVQQGIYTDSIEAVLDLLGILYEAAHAPELLSDRKTALVHHPNLTAAQRQLADALGNLQTLKWGDLLPLSQAVRSIRNMKIPVLTLDAPPYNFPNEPAYRQGLKEQAKKLANKVTANQPFTPSKSFRRELREATDKLVKKKGGMEVLSFESSHRADLDDLQINHHTRTVLQKHSGGVELADTPEHYTHVESRRPTSLHQMQRESQLDDSESRNEEPNVREGYYRAAAVYVPENYLPCHAVWNKYGSIKDARKLLEDFTSSYSE